MWMRSAACMACGIAGLLGTGSAYAVDDIFFSLTHHHQPSVAVKCGGPWGRSSGCVTLRPGENQVFYKADDNGLKPHGLWTCELFIGVSCTSHDLVALTRFCNRNNDPVQLTYDGGFSSNMPPCPSTPAPARTSSVLGFDGEDASPHREIDTFDFEGEVGETVDVVLDIDGSAGGIGEVATLRVLSESGRAIAEETGPLPLTLEAFLEGPSAIVVERARRGTGVPFRGYYTLEIAPLSGESDAASASVESDAASDSGETGERLLVPREDVEF